MSVLRAKYPIIGTENSIEISIGEPELDPKSQNDDYRCECTISSDNYQKKTYVYGIDPIQCVWLALKLIRAEIILFEKKTNMKCEYSYFDEYPVNNNS